MKLLTIFGIISALAGCTQKHESHPETSSGVHAEHHGNHHHSSSTDSSTLVIASNPSVVEAGKPVELRLMIHAADGTMVSNFSTIHEHKVHLVIVSENLEHFVHLHPEVDSSGGIRTEYVFPAAGRFRMYADYSAGGAASTATGLFNVNGQSPPTTSFVATAPGDVVADGLHATIAAGQLHSRVPSTLAFSLRNAAGNPVELESYMGELGHLMFIGVTHGQYVHVHPTGGESATGSVSFQAHFEEPGLYKGWGQFKQDGQVKVVPFVVKVE